MSDEMPEGYTHEPSTSAFVNHIGKIYNKVVIAPDGTKETWVAIRIEPHHVNTWGFAHGGFMAAMAEVGTGGGYEPGGPPVVAIDLQMHCVAAPKLGQLLEMRGVVNKRTRSLVFAESKAYADGALMFSCTAIHKIVGG